MTSRTPDYPSLPTWASRLATAGAAALAAALVAAAAMVMIYQGRPEIRLEMDRRLPPTVSGFYPLERQAKTSFAWSGGSVRLAFDRVDRRAAWACKADVINWRPASAGPATVRIRFERSGAARTPRGRAHRGPRVHAPCRPGEFGD